MSKPIRVLFESAHESAPAAGAGVRIALFQGEQPRGFEEATAQNLWRMEQAITLAADYDAHLCAFPEAYATGYALRHASPTNPPGIPWNPSLR